MQTDCCTHNCNQGRQCVRQRAGQPADYTIFTSPDPVAELEAERERQARSDLKAILFIASCILSFFLVALFWGSK